MSASREKQARKTAAPKTAMEAQQQKEERRSKLLYGGIAAALAVAVIATLVWNSNIIARFATAVTVDGQKYNAAQVSFYYRTAYMNFMNGTYGYFASYLGLDTSTSLENQTVNETAASMLDTEEGITWKEYFLRQGIRQIASVQNGLKKAQEESFSYPDSVQSGLDDAMSALSTNARASGVSRGRYLKSVYGSTMTEGIYRTEVRRTLQFQAYASAYNDSLDYTTEELEAAYAEDPNSYDQVSYEMVRFDGSTPEPAEDEETAGTAAEETAEETTEEAAEETAAEPETTEEAGEEAQTEEPAPEEAAPETETEVLTPEDGGETADEAAQEETENPDSQSEDGIGFPAGGDGLTGAVEDTDVIDDLRAPGAQGGLDAVVDLRNDVTEENAPETEVPEAETAETPEAPLEAEEALALMTAASEDDAPIAPAPENAEPADDTANTEVAAEPADDTEETDNAASAETAEPADDAANGDEEETEARAAAKEAAEALLSLYRAGGNLSQLSADLENASYSQEETATYSNLSLTSEDLADWLFDSARKSGDADVVENGDYFYTVVFRDRTRDENKTIDVRHILIRPEESELDEEDEGREADVERLNNEAHEKAQSILTEWQEGEATEDSFAALAAEYSDDSNASEGGLYTRVYLGEMVEAFEDWCFDPERKPGDTGLVETDNGWHVMYFVGDDLPRWQAQVYDDLKNEAYSTWLTALYEDAVIERHDFGMGFV